MLARDLPHITAMFPCNVLVHIIYMGGYLAKELSKPLIKLLYKPHALQATDRPLTEGTHLLPTNQSA
jgi:hypothetical protein